LGKQGEVVVVDAVASIFGAPERVKPKDHWDWSIPTPLSQGWKCGPFLFVGGQISADEKGRTVGVGDIELQTQNVFENIGKVLQDAGAEWRHVVKFNTYYVFEGHGDAVREYWEKMTEVRLRYLPTPGPVGTAVRVMGLAYPDLLIEVEAIAYVPEWAEA
jgi:2-iminobutanoate/2-iminopropanoate deaminase